MSRIASARRHPNLLLSGSSATINSKRPTSHKPGSNRDIFVPCHNLKVYPAVLKRNDLRRVKTASRIVTKEERQRNYEKFEADQRQLEVECENRKRFLKEIDKIRNEKFGTNHDPFADEKAEMEAKLLDRAFLAKHEQVDLLKS